MNDTSPEVEKRYRDILMARSPAERLMMACSMHETARQMVIASVRSQMPEASAAEVAWQVFRRFYDDDLPDAIKTAFRAGLNERLGASKRPRESW